MNLEDSVRVQTSSFSNFVPPVSSRHPPLSPQKALQQGGSQRATLSGHELYRCVTSAVYVDSWPSRSARTFILVYLLL